MPPNKKGEIIVKGPQLMKGYLDDPETTKKVLRDDWLYTGDTGLMDERGYLYIVGRKEDRKYCYLIRGCFMLLPLVSQTP